jgi:hypothetical protein
MTTHWLIKSSSIHEDEKTIGGNLSNTLPGSSTISENHRVDG